MTGREPELPQPLPVKPLALWNLYGFFDYLVVLLFVFYHFACIAAGYLLLAMAIGLVEFAYDEIKYKYKNYWDLPQLIIVDWSALQIAVFFGISVVLILWSYIKSIFLVWRKVAGVELGRDQAVVWDLIRSATKELSASRLKKVGLRYDCGDWLFHLDRVFFGTPTEPKRLEVGAASVTFMNRSEFKAFVVFSFVLNLIESKLSYTIICFTLQQELCLVHLLWEIGYIIHRILRLTIFIAIPLLASIFMLMILYIKFSAMIFLLEKLLSISIPIRKKHYILAAQCAAKAAGSQSFVECLARQKAAQDYYETTDFFLFKAYWQGFQSSDLFRPLVQIENRCKTENSDSLTGQLSVGDRNGKPSEAKRKTVSELRESFSLFEEGELESHALQMGVPAEIDKRPAWQLFFDADKLKKQLTECYYHQVIKGLPRRHRKNKIVSDGFIDDEINLDKIHDRTSGVYCNRDIEIDDIHGLVADAEKREMGKKELAYLIEHHPSASMIAFVSQLKKLKDARIRLREELRHFPKAVEASPESSTRDKAFSVTADDLLTVEKEMQVTRMEVAREDRNFFRMLWWLGWPDERSRSRLQARFSFHIELQKSRAAIDEALLNLNQFLAMVSENKAAESTENCWNQIETSAKNALKNIVSDLPKNTCVRIFFLFDKRTLREEIWGDGRELTEILNGPSAFSHPFAARLQSLLEAANKRLTRIASLNVLALLHVKEMLAIHWLIKNSRL